MKTGFQNLFSYCHGGDATLPLHRLPIYIDLRGRSCTSHSGKIPTGVRRPDRAPAGLESIAIELLEKYTGYSREAHPNQNSPTKKGGVAWTNVLGLNPSTAEILVKQISIRFKCSILPYETVSEETIPITFGL